MPNHLARGWTLMPNLRHVQLPDGTVVSSTSRGIRGTKEYTYDKPADALRILTVGDSFTFGEQVRDDQTWSYYLQNLLPGSEVLNFGVHGYGHDQMLLYLREEGIKYHPDIVILGLSQPRLLSRLCEAAFCARWSGSCAHEHAYPNNRRGIGPGTLALEACRPRHDTLRQVSSVVREARACCFLIESRGFPDSGGI
jgi:hypothetical protein